MGDLVKIYNRILGTMRNQMIFLQSFNSVNTVLWTNGNVKITYLLICILFVKLVKEMKKKFNFQVHNAEQLSDWCLSYLSQSYNSICRKFPKVLRNLHPENQAALNVNRWPPIW